jgi:HEAT repeat protein
MPDLSFIPERDLVEEAVEAPVAFAQANLERIAGLIDTADLSLLPYAEARPGIQEALASNDPIQRYWALVACSTFEKEAGSFAETAKKIAASDPDLLVRARAAEFLAIIGAQDPQPVLLDVLAKSESMMETTQVLNIITLLQDGEWNYTFDLDPDKIRTRGYFVDRCLVHLCGIPLPAKPADLN